MSRLYPAQEEPSEKQPDGSMPDPKLAHVREQWKYSSPLIACSFDPGGKYVFASAEDNSVQRWDLESSAITPFAAHDSWVRDMPFLADGQTLVTVGSDDQMIWWPVAAENPKPLKTIQAHKGWIRTVSISPDGTLLATGGNDNLVKIWNTTDGTCLHELAGHDSNVYSTLFHPEGQFLVSGDLSGQVRQWEISSGKFVRAFDASALHTYNGGQQVHYGGVRSIALSPDLKYMACSGLHKATNPLGAVSEPLVLLFDWESQELLRSHVTSDVRGIGWSVYYLADGTLMGLSGGGGGGFLLFWKPDEDKDFFKFKLPNIARDLALHPNGLQVATTHFDRHLRISHMTPKPPEKEDKKSG